MSDESLKGAAESGDINSLYSLIKEDPLVLESVNSTPFVETPLHIAARLGHVKFATEIIRLKPSFALKLNPEGWCPIHLALEHGHIIIVDRLVNINKDLVRAKKREGFSPLHMASKSGDVSLLIKFLKACPDSIEDVTIRGETALHFAVKYGKFDALKFLVKWLQTKALILKMNIINLEDDDGNTILHIAALYNNKQAIKLLTKFRIFMRLDAKNMMDETALDIASGADIKLKLIRAADIYTRRFFENILKEKTFPELKNYLSEYTSSLCMYKTASIQIDF